MRSRGIILKKSFVFVGHFSGIRLLVRVKTLILSFTLKNASQGGVFKNQGPLFKDKIKEVLKYGSIE
jgi:hypothetical protein